jgi:hypothetical protein
MSRLKELLATERGLQKEGIVKKGSFPLNRVVANFTLEQDLGLEEGSECTYEMNVEIRDRLLAHAREDAALAVGVSHSTEKLARTNQKLLYLIIIFQAVLLWKIW